MLYWAAVSLNLYDLPDRRDSQLDVADHVDAAIVRARRNFDVLVVQLSQQSLD